MMGRNCQIMRIPAGRMVARCKVMPMRRMFVGSWYQYHSPGEAPEANELDADPAMLRYERRAREKPKRAPAKMI